MTFVASAAELKRRLREVVQTELKKFEEETGVTPSNITIHMVDTSNFRSTKHYTLGDITIQLDL